MKNHETVSFNYGLPFDPFRFLLALLEKVGLILVAAVVCTGLGVAVAFLKFGNTYKASVELVSEQVQSQGGSEEVPSFTPMALSMHVTASTLDYT